MSKARGMLKLYTREAALTRKGTLPRCRQLTVHLRLCDVPVPAIYGPSADEQ